MQEYKSPFSDFGKAGTKED